MKQNQPKDTGSINLEIKLPSGDLYELTFTANNCEAQFQQFCRQSRINNEVAQALSKIIEERVDKLYDETLSRRLSNKPMKQKASLSQSEIKSNTAEKPNVTEKSGQLSKKSSKKSSIVSKNSSTNKKLKTEPKLPEEFKSKNDQVTPPKQKPKPTTPKSSVKSEMKDPERLSPKPFSPSKYILLKDHIQDDSQAKEEVKEIKKTKPKPIITVSTHLIKKKQSCDKCIKVVDTSKQKSKKLSPVPADHFYTKGQVFKDDCKRHACQVWQHSQGQKQKPRSPNRIPIATLCYSPSVKWHKTLRQGELDSQEPLPDKYAVRPVDQKIKNYYTNFKLMCAKVQL